MGVDRARVTIIVPTYNRRESLKRTLDALLACETGRTSAELRVIDDGSTDGTRELVAHLASSAGAAFRVHYHRQENQGPSAARNLGIAAADTDLLLFTDDDCVPDGRWIRALLDAPWEDGVGTVGGCVVAPAKGNRIQRYARFIRFNEFPPDEGPIRFVNTANCAFLRSAVTEVGGFESLIAGAGEDHDLAWRVVLLGYCMEYEPRALVYHYHREDLRTLLRTFYLRAYRGTLRRVLWSTQPMPTARHLRREQRSLLRLRLSPSRVAAEAVRLRRRGLPPGDAFAFAALEWLRQITLNRGRVAMMRRIIEGRQCLERTTVVPEGELDPRILKRSPTLKA